MIIAVYSYDATWFKVAVSFPKNERAGKQINDDDDVCTCRPTGVRHYQYVLPLSVSVPCCGYFTRNMWTS